MSLFHYKARNEAGEEQEGDREAKDKYELAKVLRAESLSVISIAPAFSVKKRKNLNEYMPAFLQNVSLEEKMTFTRNAGVMVGAGISLAKVLEVLLNQTDNPKFKAAINDMAGSIKSGKSFADSLEKYENIFPKFYREMVRAGEKSGKLEESLNLVALQLKKDYTLRKKVKSAAIYPAIIIVAMIGIGILMLIYVVPTLVATFAELDVELPTSTKVVIFISQSLIQSGIIIIAVFAALFYLFFRWLRSGTGKKFMDWILVNTPVIGGINRKFNAARVCRTLSSLISSGVDILEAFKVTEDVLQNHYYKDVLKRGREVIQKGGKIEVAFMESAIFPPLVGEMMAVGEETGKLSDMMLRLASFYESEVSSATQDLSSVVEPVLMILIGIVVGFFAVSMISPMYNLAGSF